MQLETRPNKLTHDYLEGLIDIVGIGSEDRQIVTVRHSQHLLIGDRWSWPFPHQTDLGTEAGDGEQLLMKLLHTEERPTEAHQ